MPKRQKPSQEFPFTIEFEGKRYSATYTSDRGGVTVDSEWGSRASQSSGDGPKAAPFTARMLFREILHDAKSREAIEKRKGKG